MTSPDVVRALRPIARWLDRHGVEYRIGGSLASSVHGVARSTLDVDLVADLPLHLARTLASDLAEEYYADAFLIEDAIRRRASFNLVHLETMVKVDVFLLGRGTYDREAFTRHERAALDVSSDGETFAVLTPEDIVLRKLLWYRQGGEISERQWNDVRGVLRVKGEGIDRRYLERWARELGIAELLDRALDESADS